MDNWVRTYPQSQLHWLCWPMRWLNSHHQLKLNVYLAVNGDCNHTWRVWRYGHNQPPQPLLGLIEILKLKFVKILFTRCCEEDIFWNFVYDAIVDRSQINKIICGRWEVWNDCFINCEWDRFGCVKPEKNIFKKF